MNGNPDITSGAGEQVVDILDNIPSDSDRRAAPAPTDRGSISGDGFRRPAPFAIFRQRRVDRRNHIASPQQVEYDDYMSDDSSLVTSVHSVNMGDSDESEDAMVGKLTHDEGTNEECKITAFEIQKNQSDIYNIAGAKDDDTVIDPMSNDYVGILANYFSVGLMIGGSTSLLYPVLIVQAGATSSLMAASYAVVMVFWSYKIVFGFLSDCFPIFGFKRKPYITIGWLFCAGVLLTLASDESEIIDPRRLVMVLAIANMGYVWADVAADGFMVWIAHREKIEKRGKMQTLVYSMSKLGQICINILILLGFSGPQINCAGYESDQNVPCTTNSYVTTRVDPELYQSNPNGWCYQKCDQATFDWDLSIQEFALSICFVIFASLPFYLRLKEKKVAAEPRVEFLMKFWTQIRRRACWQVILYGMISHITFGVMNAAKMPANYVWLNLHTFQHQVMVIFEKFVFFIGLNLVRKYGLNVSWRKMVLVGSCLVMICNSMYFLIIFDIWRDAWFYIFTDVSALFMYTLNFLASHACMVEVAEPGFEAVTYSLITTATNSVTPLSAVISYQLLAFFPSLNDQESIATDTPQVRKEFACLHILVIILNLSSLLSLPLLPRQKKETRELVAKGEKSTFWGIYVIGSAFTFLCYSTFVTIVTVKYHDVYGCMKVLGGGGCSAEESSIMASGLISLILLYCYGTTFYLSYLPVVKGERKFSLRMFI